MRENVGNRWSVTKDLLKRSLGKYTFSHLSFWSRSIDFPHFPTFPLVIWSIIYSTNHSFSMVKGIKKWFEFIKGVFIIHDLGILLWLGIRIYFIFFFAFESESISLFTTESESNYSLGESVLSFITIGWYKSQGLIGTQKAMESLKGQGHYHTGLSNPGNKIPPLQVERRNFCLGIFKHAHRFFGSQWSLYTILKCFYLSTIMKHREV